MRFLNSAIRASGKHKPKDYILAAIVTALLPSTTAALFLWLVPAGCDIRGDTAIYRWMCLLPGLMIAVPPVVALFLPIAIFLNHRLANRFPDGWLVTILAVGLLAHVALLGGYLLALGPAYRSLFLGELIFIPQPFVSGAIAAAVYWVSLHLGKRPSNFQRRQESSSHP